MTTAANMHQAFLDDIRAHPADDVPRLIYADWLDEQGDGERAEFIRLQVKLAAIHTQPCIFQGKEWPDSPPAVCALPTCPVCPEIVPLRARERELTGWRLVGSPVQMVRGPLVDWSDGIYELLTQYGNRACDLVIGGWRGNNNNRAVFRRGFVTEVYLPCNVIISHGLEIWRSAPLERVILIDKRPLFGTCWCRASGKGYWVPRLGSGPHPDFSLEDWTAATIPSGLFSYLPDVDESCDRMEFKQPMDALSHACIALLREES